MKTIIITILGVLVHVSTAFGEECDNYRADKPDGTIEWMAWGVILLSIVGLLLCAIKDARRHRMD